jgi:hypothetical protein
MRILGMSGRESASSTSVYEGYQNSPGISFMGEEGMVARKNSGHLY